MFISRYSYLTELGLRMAPATRWLVTGALLLLLSGGWYLTLYSMLNARKARECAQLQELSLERAALVKQHQACTASEQLVAHEQQAWQALVKEAQAKVGSQQLFSLLELTDQFGLSVQAYYPHAAIDRGWYMAHAAQLHVTCTFFALLDFLQALPASDMRYDAESVRVERRDTQLNVVMTIRYKVPKELNDAAIK